MSEEVSESNYIDISGFPRMEIPRARPLTREDIARRKDQVRRARELRDKIGPIGVSIEKLVREARENPDF